MSNSIFQLNEARLAEYLTDQVPGFSGPFQIEKFAGGQSNPTYLVTCPDHQYVIRRKPPGDLLKSAHAVDREYAVLRALQNTAVPVARPLCLCEDASVIGSMFYVMSYVPGRIFWNPALPELDKENRSAILNEMVTVLANLHEVDVGAVGLAGFGKPGNYFERQLDRWSRQYRAAETQPIKNMESLMGWLADNMPEDDGQVSLIHGDYRLDNIIFDPQQPGALALLDWELATLGHPMADLAYFCMCLRLPPDGQIKGLGGLDRAALGVPTETDLIARYCSLRGVDRIENWAFYLAFSFFRLAAIAQGVLKRALDGNASNENALEAGSMVTVLAQLALDLIEKEP